MTSTLWVVFTTMVFMVNLVLSAPPAYVTSTRPTVRLSDQEFDHIIQEQQENTKQNNQPPPNEQTLASIYIVFSSFVLFNSVVNVIKLTAKIKILIYTLIWGFLESYFNFNSRLNIP